MSTALFSREQQLRFALSASAMLGMPELLAAVETEVEATFDAHPMLPRTDATRRVLWGLVLPNLSQAATQAASQPKTPAAA